MNVKMVCLMNSEHDDDLKEYGPPQHPDTLCLAQSRLQGKGNLRSNLNTATTTYIL